MAPAGQGIEQLRQAQDVDDIPTLAWSARPDGADEALGAFGIASLTLRLTTSRSGRNAYQATKSATAATGIATFIHLFISVSP
jgi:hypothetical protein